MRTGLTVAAVIAATTLTPAPATAGEGNYFSRLACVSYDGHKSCQQVNWSKRRGRHGVTLQRFKITTASEEPANFHQYKDVTLKWRAKGGGPVDYTYELGTEPKTVYRDVSNASPGRARVHGPHVLRRKPTRSGRTTACTSASSSAATGPRKSHAPTPKRCRWVWPGGVGVVGEPLTDVELRPSQAAASRHDRPSRHGSATGRTLAVAPGRRGHRCRAADRRRVLAARPARPVRGRASRAGGSVDRAPRCR